MTGEATLSITDQGTRTAADRLGSLFDAHSVRLYRLARRLSNNPEDARDLVQEAFVRAARRPASIPEPIAQQEAWLVRILVNLCRDRWRQTAARGRLDRAGAIAPPLHQPDPESALIAHSVVWDALGALAPRRRAVLVMYELEGITIAAIAKTLRLTPVTIRWHLSMGRRQLAAIVRSRGSKV